MKTKILSAGFVAVAMLVGAFTITPCTISAFTGVAFAQDQCPKGYCMTTGGCCKLGSGCACR
jgi:hypothetical protein